MIKCPKTGKYFSFGIQIAPESFKTSMFQNNQSPCPHCGENHSWGMAEVRLLEERES